MNYVDDESVKTLIPLADSSWFTGGNVPGKHRSALIFFGDFGKYRRRVDNVAADGYVGFRMSDAPRQERLQASRPGAATTAE